MRALLLAEFFSVDSHMKFGQRGAASRQGSKQNTCATAGFSALVDKTLPSGVNFPPRACGKADAELKRVRVGSKRGEKRKGRQKLQAL